MPGFSPYLSPFLSLLAGLYSRNPLDDESVHVPKYSAFFVRVCVLACLYLCVFSFVSLCSCACVCLRVCICVRVCVRA